MKLTTIAWVCVLQFPITLSLSIAFSSKLLLVTAIAISIIGIALGFIDDLKTKNN